MLPITTVNNFSGFIKVWKINTQTGVSELVIDKKNLILYQGSDLLALALGGVKNAKISNLYVGYTNIALEDAWAISPLSINKDYSTQPFSAYGSSGAPFNLHSGYLRLPLSYAPMYQASSSDYTSNQVIFSATIGTNVTATGGEAFQYVQSSSSPSHVHEVALAAALDPGNPAKDLFFSRASFTPIPVDQNYNLAISWGIQFLS